MGDSTPAAAGLRILVVDDERLTRLTVAEELTEAGYTVETADRPEAALERLASEHWDVVLTDLRMPGMDGLSFLATARARDPGVDFIVMTAYATIATAVEAMTLGAADYIAKPFRFDEVSIRLRRLAEQRAARRELRRLRGIVDGTTASMGIVGRSPAMRRAFERLRLFADSPAPVLITGETGTGKELASRAIHDLGPRAAGPFVALPCGAVPRELAESQLFGHERGAFTGAVGRRRGCFEQAHRGTLLLDDVDDLPLEVQVKLLRALQEGRLQRVGSEEEQTVDVRVIATSKVDLAAAVAAGRFRTDLLYRLRGLEVRLPALRDREDDVLLLAHHFLGLLASGAAGPARSLGLEAARIVRAYDWPGNVRELRRAMETAFTLSRGGEIGLEHLPEYLTEHPAPRCFSLHLDGRDRVSLPELMRDFEEAVVRWALREANGNQSRAAELLQVPRTTLQSKLGRTA